MFTLPEHCKVVLGAEPQVSGSGDVTGDYVCLKNYHKMWAVVTMIQGNAATTTFTPMKATAVAPTAETAVTAAVPWWENEDCATSDLLVRQTDATTLTSSATTKNKIFICEIDPAAHGATYDCFALKVGDSNVANLFSVMYYLLPSRYAADQPPSAIID